MPLLLTLIAAAAAPSVPAAVQVITENGTYVMRTATDAKPLYTFDRDEPGKSNCVDRCASAWPPLPAVAGAKPVGKWSIVTRADGSLQWAYDAKPVYTFIRDTGSVATGDGMGGSWHLLPTAPVQ